MKIKIILIALVIILGGALVHHTIQLDTLQIHYQFTIDTLKFFMGGTEKGKQLHEEVSRSQAGKFDV